MGPAEEGAATAPDNPSSGEERVAHSRLSVGIALCLVAACGGPSVRTLPVPEVGSTVTEVAAPVAAPTPETVAVTPPGSMQAASIDTAIAVVEPDTLEELPVAPAGPPPPAWDIEVAPYESHDRVSHFVGRFSGPMRETFELSLMRQSRYAPMIHEKLRAGGLPEDMIYLPLIESWYDPHAYSRAAAVGMWQFMTRTAKGVGLRVDWWVDERRDPVRATDGAVTYLNQLREELGSLYLAAAAYNGGSSRITKGLERHASALEGTEGDELFFALSQAKVFREETSDYVPKLIAAALVGKEPARYGVEVNAVLPFAWDSVIVPAATPLAAVAKAAEMELDTLLDYNPQILRGMTPPSGPAMWLRVPVGHAERFAVRFDSLPVAERTAIKRIVTKEGDFITAIAKKHGLTSKQLNWYNPQATRLKNGNLHAGQRILVPRKDVAAAARDVPNPAIERYGSAAGGVHVVKRGETLGHIARRNGTTVARLKALNKMKTDVIRIGQRIRVR
jgi:membrane-bound lytic murein transglycosylase D